MINEGLIDRQHLEMLAFGYNYRAISSMIPNGEIDEPFLRMLESMVGVQRRPAVIEEYIIEITHHYLILGAAIWNNNPALKQMPGFFALGVEIVRGYVCPVSAIKRSALSCFDASFFKEGGHFMRVIGEHTDAAYTEFLSIAPAMEKSRSSSPKPSIRVGVIGIDAAVPVDW